MKKKLPKHKSNLSLNKELNRLKVPKSLYLFYKPADIIKIGQKLRKSIYFLDNFIFKVEKDEIVGCYYGIELLKQHPEYIK